MPEDDFLSGLEEGAADDAAEETADETEDISTGTDDDAADTGDNAGGDAGTEDAEPETEEKPAATEAAKPPESKPEPQSHIEPKAPEITQLEQLAKDRGLSMPALIEQLHRDSAAARAQERQQKVQSLADLMYADLQAKYANTAEEGLLRAHAFGLAENTIRGQEEAAAKDRMERDRAVKAEQQKVQQAMQEPWTRYFQKYPTADAKNLPAELLLKVKGGLSPIEAQMEIELAQLKSAATKETQKKANQAKAVGSLRGASGKEAPDPFLDGLYSD